MELLVVGIVLCMALVVTAFAVRAIASTYPREVTVGHTEALEAWQDAFDAVLNPYACSIEDVDAHIFEALEAADRAVAGMTVKLPKGKTMLYSPGHYYYDVPWRSAKYIRPEPPPKPLDARRSVMSADYERRVAALEQRARAIMPLDQKYPLQVIEPVWEYGCPECHSMTPSPDRREFCSVCGYAPPPDGRDVDLSKWDAETQSFNRAAERAFGLPKNSLTGHHPDESPFTMPLMEEIDGKRDKRPKPERPSPMKRSRF